VSEHRTLPHAPTPRGRYVPALVHGTLAFSAGMTPRIDGVLIGRGIVGEEVTEADARRAAGVAALNAVAAVAEALGGVHHIERCLRMVVYVACSPHFEHHSLVADGASDAIRECLGDHSLPVRTAIGVQSLPGGAPVEVELTVAVAVDA
jgi:enamine deaminase RidA (YjgF/YER057c/UK114 family)